MSESGWVGFLIACLMGAGVAAFLATRRAFLGLVPLILAGVALRVAGSIARHEIMTDVYGGVADALGYYFAGRRYAAFFLELDPALVDPSRWFAGTLWGTQFVRYVSGGVILLVGHSMRGGFLVFGLLSFIGLVAWTLAFRASKPEARMGRYLAWLMLWPSLWYWPASIGKDALVLLAAGLVALGFVGRDGRVRYTLLGTGMLLTFMIRPHVAAVFAVAVGAAQWLGKRPGGRPAAVGQLVILGVLGAAVVWASVDQLGLETDFEGVKQYIDRRATLTERGGSGVGAAAEYGIVLGVPVAFVNVLGRPFVFEAHNPLAAIAALEMTVFWVVVLFKRKAVIRALRAWRQDRLVRFSLVTIVLYVAMLGLAIGNLGIIARQRVMVFPMLFAILTAGDAVPRPAALAGLRAAPGRAPWSG